MALSRLWWIPQGAKAERGGYVNYPFHELLAILAAESRRARCLVIGEDLGTVPAELRTALNEAGVLSYRPLLFEKDAGDRRRAYPRDALVCVSTHDLPTWRGYWEAHDLKLREQARPDASTSTRSSASGRRTRRSWRAPGSSPSHGRGARVHRAHAVEARHGAARGRVRARRAGEPARHGRPAPELAPQAAARARALARRAARRGARRDDGRAQRREGRAAASCRSRPTACSSTRASASRTRTALVPYLASLGISHVYASPFLKARPGSTHGYDVIDHNAVNPEIGTESGAERADRAAEEARHGHGARPRAQPHGRAARRQRVVARRAGEGPRLALREVLRHRLAARQAAAAGAGQALRRGARVRRAEAGTKGGKWSVRYFDHRFPAECRNHSG